MLQGMLAEKVHGSIDIGSKNVRALSISKGKIDRIIKRSIVMEDGRDEQVSEGLKAALSEVVDDLKLKGKNVTLSISGQKFYSKSIVIGREDDEDKRQEMIHEELESIVPNYDPLDFLTEEITIRKDDDDEEILTISIERERIEDLLDLMTKLKVKILKILPDYISCYHLIEQKIAQDPMNNYSGVTGVIDVGYEGTKVYFMDHSGIKMFINTLIGGGEFTEIIREHKKTTYEDAEKVKKEIELGEKTLDDGDEVTLFTELTNTFKELEENISVSLDFFTKKSITANVQRLILVGEGSLLKGFKEYLHERTRIVTEYIDYEDLDFAFDLESKLDDYHSVEVANLLGNVIGEVS